MCLSKVHFCSYLTYEFVGLLKFVASWVSKIFVKILATIASAFRDCWPPEFNCYSYWMLTYRPTASVASAHPMQATAVFPAIDQADHPGAAATSSGI